MNYAEIHDDETDEEMRQSVRTMIDECVNREEAKELATRAIRKQLRPGTDPAPAIYDAERFIDQVYDEHESTCR